MRVVPLRRSLPTKALALIVVAAAMLAPAGPARAQPVDAMLSDCEDMARSFFRDTRARTPMRCNGRRSDVTETVGGDIFLETRSAYVACAFGPRGRRMVEFLVDGQDHTGFATGGQGGGQRPGPGGPAFLRVTGGPAGDVLNVRADLSARDRIVGAPGNGDRVRDLGCQDVGRARWCLIGFLDEMGGEGWVNARFLSADAGGHRPRPPATGNGGTGTERVRFPPGRSGTELARSLRPGESTRFVLNARNRHELHVRVVPEGGAIDYQIFNPDGTFLLEMIRSDRPCRGALWQSGDHVVEAINRRRQRVEYSIIIGID